MTASTNASVNLDVAPQPNDSAARAGSALGLPPCAALLPREGWIALIALIIAMGIVVPVSALVLPETITFHLPAYAMTLIGKLLICYAIGGYAMGIYLMHSIGREGTYKKSDLPDFMVFLDDTSCRGTGKAPSISGMRCYSSCSPGCSASSRSGRAGVYLSIINV